MGREREPVRKEVKRCMAAAYVSMVEKATRWALRVMRFWAAVRACGEAAIWSLMLQASKWQSAHTNSPAGWAELWSPKQGGWKPARHERHVMTRPLCDEWHTKQRL